MAAPIPVIDLAGAHGPDREKTARALVDAAVEHGFVYVRDSGREIPLTDIDEAFRISRKLFALPTEEKESCKIGTNNRGWLGMNVEALDPEKAGDTKEAFNFGAFVDGQPQQPLPTALASDAPRIATFFDRCHGLCLTLNDLLGIGLDVDPPDFFTAAHRKEAGPAGNTLRFLYYPKTTSTSSSTTSTVRAGAHSDYGSMTLLFRLPGQAGLEILKPDGSWAPVPVCPNQTSEKQEKEQEPPILVNIGDLLSYWTGGLLRSTVHRVAAPASPPPGETVGAEPRYSIAFFCHPADASPLKPVPSKRVAAAVAASAAGGGAPSTEESKVLTASDHLQMRLHATYKDLYKA